MSLCWTFAPALVLLLTLSSTVSGFQQPSANFRSKMPLSMLKESFRNNDNNNNLKNFNRPMVKALATTLISMLSFPMLDARADAQQSVNQQGGLTLAAQLKKYQEAQAVIDAADIPYVELPSGVSYREFREGKGLETVKTNSKVRAEMVIRCMKFATADEPGGVKYFSTKSDTPDNALTWTIGSGALPPGLEEAMVGMKKGTLRRIELPSVQVFAARDANQLPLPSTSNADGQRRFKNLFKTEAKLLFEVLVKSVKNENNE